MQTALIITAIVIAIFIIMVIRTKISMKNIPLVTDHENVLTLTDKNFKNQTKNNVVLVDFWAAWCGPCRMMAPVLNEIAGELKGNSYIGKVNVEQYQSLAQKYKVRGIPTMVLFKNGVEVNRFVGVKSKEYRVKQIQSA
jgi:thioredoxin 1